MQASPTHYIMTKMTSSSYSSRTIDADDGMTFDVVHRQHHSNIIKFLSPLVINISSWGCSWSEAFEHWQSVRSYMGVSIDSCPRFCIGVMIKAPCITADVAVIANISSALLTCSCHWCPYCISVSTHRCFSPYVSERIGWYRSFLLVSWLVRIKAWILNGPKSADEIY